MIRCEGGELYTGITTDPDRRFKEHLSGTKGAKYTKRHKPVRMEAVWDAEDRSTASKLEFRLKRLSHTEKEEVIAGSKDIPSENKHNRVR